VTFLEYDDVGTQLCDLCGYPVFSDIVQVVEFDCKEGNGELPFFRYPIL